MKQISEEQINRIKYNPLNRALETAITLDKLPDCHCDELRRALEFYADKNNWMEEGILKGKTYEQMKKSKVEKDGGQVAHNALNGREAK